jgi:hypothetical protein
MGWPARRGRGRRSGSPRWVPVGGLGLSSCGGGARFPGFN